jgi:hypothetical protein
VTTWSDGENGGWFRQTDENSGFFGFFFAPYMEHVRTGEFPARPVSLSTYIEQHPTRQQAFVETGAWNVGSTSGFDFAQWAGSDAQRKALEKVISASRRFHQLSQDSPLDDVAKQLVEEAHRVLLEAQTSCYLFWGDSWIPHLYTRTQRLESLLEQIDKQLGKKD